MTRTPRFALWAAMMLLIAPAAALAQDAPPPAKNDLQNAVENFWHYGKIARYDLATTEAQKIINSGADPLTILTTFEAVAAERQDNLDEWLLRWRNVEGMKDVADRIIKINAEGYQARRSDPKFITDQIARLSTNERAYGLAMTRLRESGELAVPFMIDILRDPQQKQMQPVIRRALRDLGKYALNPLVAATEMQEWDTLAVVVNVLGDLGYPAAAPYVSRLFESNQTPASVKAASLDALTKLGVSRAEGNAAPDLFYDLAEKFYYNNTSISADSRYAVANVWYWEPNHGLVRRQVPPGIFSPIMAMRACEYALKLGGARTDDAMSLWLASNYRREAELPEGAADTTRPENYPSAHYWGVQSGVKYLNVALARAIHDRNAALAFRVIRSLQGITGHSHLGESGKPLVDAMQFPDRKVRFEAAFALASALPQEEFQGSQRVVPLLAEAMAQTGQGSLIVVMPTQDVMNKLVDELKNTSGYAVAGATSAEEAISIANTLPAVDVIIVSEEIGAGKVDQLFNMANENARLAGSARLVLVKTAASMYEPRKVYDPLLSTSTATDGEGLKPAIEEARAKAGALPLEAEVATEYATRAGELMLKLGIARGEIFPLGPAKSTLLSALTDPRPQIVMLAGQVLGMLNDKDAQAGLLAVAADENTADELKIRLYKSLASNAKLFGNMLEGQAVQTLEQTVADAQNLDVRSAAAEARGALNLPAEQAKTLIIRQSKM